MAKTPRKHERVAAAIPVRLEAGGEGMTRDLSPAGVYFVVNEGFHVRDSIRFTLEFDTPSGKLYLDCVGEVVRLEESEGRAGVAVKITESRLERRNGSAATTEA